LTKAISAGPAWRSLVHVVRAVLDERLDSFTSAPLAVAFSGGGDSLALLLAARAWASGARRPVLAITVDHRLQSAAADWALWCEARARRLGVDHVTLAWAGEKPVAGLAAAARAARHRLIAEAARVAGAHVVLMGHTADDLAEARVMRATDGVPSDPKTWSPSPAWPEGRGIFILRPLLGVRRAAIRAALAEAGETWIEDPANSDPRHARARARAMLGGSGEPDVGAPTPDMVPLLAQVREGAGGELVVDRELLRDAPRPVARRLLAAAVLCASGGSRPPRGARLDRVLDRLALTGPFAGTLAGARVETDGLGRVTVSREAGEFERAGFLMIDLPVGRSVIWDGRLECSARRPGLRLRPLDGDAARLPAAQREARKRLAPAVRRALPALVDEAGQISCPILAADPRAEVRSLVMARLAAALGAVPSEAAIASCGEHARNILNGGLDVTRRVHEYP